MEWSGDDGGDGSDEVVDEDDDPNNTRRDDDGFNRFPPSGGKFFGQDQPAEVDISLPRFRPQHDDRKITWRYHQYF